MPKAEEGPWFCTECGGFNPAWVGLCTECGRGLKQDYIAQPMVLQPSAIEEAWLEEDETQTDVDANAEQEKNVIEDGEEINRKDLDSVGNTFDILRLSQGKETRLEQSASQDAAYTTPPKKEVSDSESDFSDNESTWSSNPSTSSQSSYGDIPADVSKELVGKLVEVLWESDGLSSLYQNASSMFDREEFSKIHDRVLKTFFQELRNEVEEANQLQTVRLLRQRDRRKQVTSLIYVLSTPEKDPEEQKTHKTFFDQRTDRDEALRQFLHSKRTPTAVPDHEDFDRESSSSSDDESGDNVNLIQWEELNAIVKFLTHGASFKQLRVNILCFLHPGREVQAAITTANTSILSNLLDSQFNRVAAGEYAWLKELVSADFTTTDIAELLHADHSESPWIFFEPQVSSLSPLTGTREEHASGCVHANFNNAERLGIDVGNEIFETIDDDLSDQIQELCGLAGVVPNSRDVNEWYGTVVFGEGAASATVSYSTEGNQWWLKSDLGQSQKILERARVCINRFINAFDRLQSAGLCCSSFTIAVHRNLSPTNDKYDPVELQHVEMFKVDIFAKCLEVLAVEAVGGSFADDSLVQTQQSALEILDILGDLNLRSLGSISLPETLHIISLTAQFLSLGFLMYNQAHVEPLRPFFLDRPLSEITLLGGYDNGYSSLRINVKPMKLTCIGEMLRAPVMTFWADNPKMTALHFDSKSGLDLIASPEDLLDTWGPGNFIGTFDEPRLKCGIRLCGGAIYCVDEEKTLFHWSRDVKPSDIKPIPLELKTVLHIGAVVIVNQSCQIDERDSWSRSRAAFEYLGARDDHWRHDESQIGGQAGQYVILQYNRTWHKIPGKSLKKLILEYDARAIINVLDCLWGLQVSFCTGITRRVTLRLLIADLLPVFAKSFSDDNFPWDQYNVQYQILDAFQTDTVRDRMSTLPTNIASHLCTLMHRILSTLESTGIDAKGDHLMVAWPQDRPPFHCLKIPCHKRSSSWVRVLADSIDCATFAYITTSCLETKKIKCRGPSSLWHNTTPLLETAIIRHNENPSKPLGLLEHKQTYFFKKPNELLQVTVERLGTAMGSGEVSLYVQPSSIPARIRQRVLRMEMSKRKDVRIRERSQTKDLGAEPVSILTKCEHT
ncbi:hypothetical protein CC80DRAFT_451401 [Byssothecium circinans]|uniref:RanBP2-type domain-containing protein n=1 Tax=Byssothecium circinans TaxID=147558 RepID=A0A6A5TMQ6_9PLEO|nr:hypothetical protein CC80DRAFT_451401 [Byssothecium circinans]